MSFSLDPLSLSVGGLIGAVIAWALYAGRLAAARAGAVEKLALLEEARSALTDSFKALSSDALRDNTQAFLNLAEAKLSAFQQGAKGDLEQRQKAIEAVMAPLSQSLGQIDGQLRLLEQSRVGAYEGLRAQVNSLVESQQQLRAETGNLVRALRSPSARGRWGELQLRRVVELAGMLEHCDFVEQASMDVEGAQRRPDLLIKLPGGRTIIIDAKAPLEAYFGCITSG